MDKVVNISSVLSNIDSSYLCNFCSKLGRTHFDTYKCSTCLNEKKIIFNKIIKFLEDKDINSFINNNPNCYKNEKPNLINLFNANMWGFDVNTIKWICLYETPKKLIEKLVDVGIINILNYYSSLNNIDDQSVSIFFIERNDEDILWLIYLGFKPPPQSYKMYMQRSDKTFSQKLRMLDYLYKICDVALLNNNIEECFEASKDINEVKLLIEWFVEKNCHVNQYDVLIGFRIII